MKVLIRRAAAALYAASLLTDTLHTEDAFCCIYFCHAGIGVAI